LAVETTSDTAGLYTRPAELLQRLLRYDTTNPPGAEGECIAFVKGLLDDAGFETTLLALDPARPNLIARLPGAGAAPPLLLHGHVDVVTTANQTWQQPPFEGRLQDGWIWGRGALDMKGGVAMMLSAVLRAKVEGVVPPGDVMLVVLSDEEAGSDMGAKYLVEQHADLFQGVRFAVGEGGGTTRYVDGRRFYPIMVIEKQMCWMRAVVRGPGGHGSRPMRGGTMAKLAAMLDTLDRNRLPVHVPLATRRMIEEMAEVLSPERGRDLRRLLNEGETDAVLDTLGPLGQFIEPMLHNTVNATIVSGGHKINVIPSEVVVEMDGRLLPGYTSQDMLDELGRLLGPDVELEVLRYDRGPGEPDMGLYQVMADVLRAQDPEGAPVPMLLSAVTDGRFWAQLGMQPYGFLPMQFPDSVDPVRLVHAADERTTPEAVEFGANAIYQLIQRFGSAS